MTAAVRSLQSASPASARRLRRTRLPSPRRAIAAIVLLAVGALVSTALSTLAYLRLPAPTGSFGVGREATVLVDAARSETHTPATDDPRNVRLVAWYPTETRGGAPGPYMSALEAIADGLVASGELNAVQVAALGAAASNATDGAPISQARATWPLVILSPGNATNVEFYGTIAEELASHGFAVVGVDHPYQVTAVALDGGSVAVYEGDGEAPGQLAAGDDRAAAKIAERVADIDFVLDRLAERPGLLSGLAGRLDLDRIAVVGHSNGGVAGAELCASDSRVDACLNIDGILAGGPFSATTPIVPSKPFMFLTKETELHPRLADVFEAGGIGTFRVIVPAATHGAFADGPRFVPRVLPLDGDPDRSLRVARGFAVAFLRHVLLGEPRSLLGGVDAPTDVVVEVYPLDRDDGRGG